MPDFGAMSPRATLSKYEPSVRQRIGNAVYDMARFFGMGPVANRMRNEAQTALDFIPGVGEVVGVNDAARDYSSGNYGLAAAGLGATLIGAIPGAGDVVSAGAKKGIRAFHGSPHDFDRFDTSKIGTGEGAQSYGRGLYFAENEDVARSYRDKLAGERSTANNPIKSAIGKELLDSAGGDPVKARKLLDREFSVDLDPSVARNPVYQQAAQFLDNSNSGHMYEVNIDARPDQFVEWDENELADPESIERLKREGAVGIRYQDAGSRGREGGTSNYVVFDDSIIQIVRKYGVAGALAAGLITQEMAEQMKSQGEA